MLAKRLLPRTFPFMLDANPLGNYTVDQLMAEVMSRLGDDPRVGLLFLMSEFDSSSKLRVNTKIVAHTSEALRLLTTSLADTIERLATNSQGSGATLN